MKTQKYYSIRTNKYIGTEKQIKIAKAVKKRVGECLKKLGKT